MIKERCGVFGIYAFDENWNVSRFIYYGLVALQNRGQETCGIAVFDGKEVKAVKGRGLAENFFTQSSLEGARGWAGIGHVSPLNPQRDENIQPVYVNDGVRVALCYNGKVLNYKELVEGRFKPEEEDAVAV
ncbi:MAG: amidophosphoribosyltransferase, partial [Candidatus Freyarchaeota archaeon]|nr:amidophosphoribosyltransferase [Candidatus Jordarchaeia archaeon]